MNASVPSRLSHALADRYRIERELGQGGMATVYLAEDLKHTRKVALKVLSPDLAASLGHERFLREITNTASLRHPNILPLFDSGDADGLLYYVMPLVEGETLRDRLDREKQLPLDDALRITVEVAEALRYAHDRGLVHRDVKPENILLEGGHAVVADFGIARAITSAGGESLTQTGLAIGTPTYMSPEQSAGEPNVDGRSDQYSLACVTYEMLAGQPPFTGPTVASVVHQHLSAPPRPISQLRAAVPVAVANALQRALAKDPVDRFATPTEFAAALTIEGGVKARRRLRPVLVGLVVLIAIGGGGIAWRMSTRATADGLDSNVIAALPFRVGGDPATSYLRESMLDLLQARLMNAAGPRTVEPRTLLAAWRRAVSDESADLSGDASAQLARKLGAGRMLLGSAIATPKILTITAALSRVADGKELARETVSGPPDSIAVLVDRLTGALLIGEAGESRKEGGLSHAPLDALQDYLAGRKASRRGDYFGAMSLFTRAYTRDSTFAEAAFAMVSTNSWIGTVFTTAGVRIIPRVWDMRDRLGARDLALFLAMPMVGPNYPHPSTNADIIAQAERAANAALDSPEHWLLVGQLLSRYGAAASRTDWAAQSAAALDRAIALDSSLTLAIGERLFTAIAARDSAAAGPLTALFEARVSAGFTDEFILWAAARARGDSASAMKWRAQRDGANRTDYLQKLAKIVLHSAALSLSLGDATWASGVLSHEAGSAPEQVGASLADLALGFAAGRADIHDQTFGKIGGPQWASTLIQQALVEPAYRPLAIATLKLESAGAYQVPLEKAQVRWPPVHDCMGTLLRLAGGDTTGAAASMRRLRSFEGSDRPPLPPHEWQHNDFRVCNLLIETLVKGTPARGESRPSLDRLDSLMQQGPRNYMGIASYVPTTYANYTIARLREAQGDLPRALAAIRRRDVDYFPAYTWSVAAFLRQEGRLAALTGDSPAALRAYDGYLAMRTAPDPAFRPQRDSVIAERARLIGRLRS